MTAVSILSVKTLTAHTNAHAIQVLHIHKSTQSIGYIQYTEHKCDTINVSHYNTICHSIRKYQHICRYEKM